MHKVKSHRNVEHIAKGEISPFWYFGNELADGLAGVAALECELPLEVTGIQEWIDATARLVRARAAEVLISVMDGRSMCDGVSKCKRLKLKVVRRLRCSRLSRCVASSQHDIAELKGKFHCNRCGQCCSNKGHSGGKLVWLASKCSGSSEARAVEGKKGVLPGLQLKRQSAHSSQSAIQY